MDGKQLGEEEDLKSAANRAKILDNTPNADFLKKFSPGLIFPGFCLSPIPHH
jgi:hypothetical protein